MTTKLLKQLTKITLNVSLGQFYSTKSSTQKTILSFLVLSAIKVFKATKMPSHVTIVENGATENVMPFLKKHINIMKTIKTILRLLGTAYTAP